MTPEPLTLKSGVTLYLARHGQTRANVEHRFSSKLDTPLTALGLSQARDVGRIMLREVGAKPALKFVASPLARAQTTMGIVLEELGWPKDHFTTEPRIAEIDLGLWDQLTDDEARALDAAAFDARAADKWHVNVPGGENYAQVARRALEWANGLEADTFAVSHGALSRILRGLLMGLSWQAMSSLDEPQGVVFRIQGNSIARLDL